MKHNKIIIWGAKLDTGHTHGFIHEAIYRAGKYMDIPTYWMDNRDLNSVTPDFFDDALIITEQWLVFKNGISNALPLRPTSTYLVHYLGNKGPVEGNLGAEMYLGKVGKLIDFRFNAKYGWGNNGVEDKNYDYKFEPEKYEAISDVSFYEKSKDFDRLYSIWATDLLPNEFDFDHRLTPLENRAFFCGTIRDDNQEKFIPFIKKCEEHKIPFLYNTPWQNQMPTEQVREFVRTSLLALDVRPDNHLANGYIACRPIKNVSYGALPMTNSKEIYEFFDGECAYANNSGDLFDVAIEMQKDEKTKDKILNQMKRVKEKHTYINRLRDMIIASEI